MDEQIKKYDDFLNESKTKESFEDFSATRLAGATKITDAAKEKGGDALLTYHHFKVKLPTYRKAKDGKFDKLETEKEYKDLLDKLYSSTKENMDITQVDFQEIVGKIEVLGELLIRQNK
jgi:hypothetical protein